MKPHYKNMFLYTGLQMVGLYAMLKLKDWEDKKIIKQNK